MLARAASVAAAETDGLAAAAQAWLTQFEHALAHHDAAALRALFQSDSHWRDVLALTWGMTTVSGAGAIVAALTAHAGAAPSAFRLDPQRTPPRLVKRAGTERTEAIFAFETS